MNLPNNINLSDFILIEVENGRKISYMEWGDPYGFPIFYFHGTPSSRIEGALVDASAKNNNFRLIALDRPGFGKSSFHKKRSFKDWVNDVEFLADKLNINHFGVAGHSGAGPYLFACGVYLDSERLKFIGALSPWGPITKKEIAENLNLLDRFYMNISKRSLWIMRSLFAPLGWCAKYWPNLFFYIMKRSVSKNDKGKMKNKDFIEIFKLMEIEAFNQGSRGSSYEAYMAYNDWGFDLKDIKVPTCIYLGDKDIFVSKAMGRLMEKSIYNVDFNWVLNGGHFITEKWENIFVKCNQYI